MVIAHHFVNANKRKPNHKEWTLVLLDDDTICAARYINDNWEFGDRLDIPIVIGWMELRERERILYSVIKDDIELRQSLSK